MGNALARAARENVCSARWHFTRLYTVICTKCLRTFNSPKVPLGKSSVSLWNFSWKSVPINHVAINEHFFFFFGKSKVRGTQYSKYLTMPIVLPKLYGWGRINMVCCITLSSYWTWCYEPDTIIRMVVHYNHVFLLLLRVLMWIRCWHFQQKKKCSDQTLNTDLFSPYIIYFGIIQSSTFIL